MKAGMKHAWTVFVLVSIFLMAFPCYSQDSGAEQVGSYGIINWIDRKIVAVGIGTTPENHLGKPSARPMTQRAAVTVARRNLLEVVKGIHINSTTRVENAMVLDDKIVATVRGILNSSKIDGYRYIADGSVEATVSMSLTGPLGEALLRMAARKDPATGESTVPNIEGRVYELERRVKILEDKLVDFQGATDEQADMLRVLKQVILAWIDQTARVPMMVTAGYSEEQLASMTQKLAQQESRLTMLSAKMDHMAKRLADLERIPPDRPAEKPPKTPVPYTGLVIDARGTGFRPCLRPEIYGMQQLLYPGSRVDSTTAVRTGYVRYYRQIGRAQQSSRVGTLPLTVKANGVYKGERSLSLGTQAYENLKQYVDAAADFLTDCKVVIVF